MFRSVTTGWKFFTQDARGRVFVFGALVTVALWLSLRDFNSYQFGFQPDAVEYTLLSHALLRGPSYGLLYAPDAPAPTHFPFGFPLLLIPFVLVTPNDFTLPQWLSLGQPSSMREFYFGVGVRSRQCTGMAGAWQ